MRKEIKWFILSSTSFHFPGNRKITFLNVRHHLDQFRTKFPVQNLPFVFIWRCMIFWRKESRFGSKYFQYQHISIQSTMNPSAQRKTQLKFRYQIQYTNEISDNDFFQFRSQAESGPFSSEKYQHSGNGEEGIDFQMWKSKDNRKKIGKEQPIILVKNLTSEGNNEMKNQSQQLSNNKAPEDRNNPKTPNKHTTPKKCKSNINTCMMTTITKDAKGSQEEQVKVKSSRKGLAWISSHILQLLEGEYRSENRFTCGQISDKVLTDFYSTPKQKNEENSFEEKEKKTIRRRVYDSINVLIALGKIKKWQKYLYVESIDRKIGEEIVVAKKEKLASFKQGLLKKQATLNKAKMQYSKLMELKARNEQLSESKQQGYSGTFSTFSPGHNIYRFPLLLLYSLPTSKMRIQVSKNIERAEQQPQDQIIISSISSDPFLYLLSDLTCLQYLNFSSQNRLTTIKKDKEKQKK